MLLNPRHGALGLVTVPFYCIFEMVGPVIEVTGLGVMLLSLALGLVDWSFAAMFFCVAVLLGIVLSLVAIFLEGLTYHRYPTVSSGAILMTYGLLENFGYRQIHAVWRLRGLWDWLRGESAWGAMKRSGFGSPAPILSLGQEREVSIADREEEPLRAVVGDEAPGLTPGCAAETNPNLSPASSARPAIVPLPEVKRAAEASTKRRRLVAPRASYEIRRVPDGVEVTIRGRRETTEILSLEDLERSVRRAAYAYIERHLGPRKMVGDKGASLAKRLRAALDE
jgi:hypothetical protein